MSNLIFGIDLGTTNTALSYLSVVDGRATVNLLKNRDGDELTPSVVYFHPGSLESIVGTPALLKYVEDPDRTFRWVKRDMGTPLTWDLGTGDNIQIITPQTIAALILRFICTDA
jgi:molecular chaperone DnaK